MPDDTENPPPSNPVDPDAVGAGSYNGPVAGDVVDCRTCEKRISRQKWFESHAPQGHVVLGGVYVPTYEEQPWAT
jgi:hypothetical protein